MIDLNNIDSISQATTTDLLDPNLIDRDVLESLNENFKEQYIDFVNLGTDLINTVEDKKYLFFILQEMCNYINDNYTAIPNINNIDTSDIISLELGKKIYNFFCVDSVLNIIPNYLDYINVVNCDQFEIFYKQNLGLDPSNFKTSIVSSIKETLKNLERIKNLDPSLENKKDYINIVEKLKFYTELVNFGDSTNFIFNYFIPLFRKNEGQIIGSLL